MKSGPGTKLYRASFFGEYMANICETLVSISGPYEDIKKFVSDFMDDKQGFVLERVYPRKEEEDPDAFVREWGCRWYNPGDGFLVTGRKGEPSRLRFYMDTPWGPPRDMFTKISLDRPSLEIELTYEEQSLDEAGLFAVSNGKVSRDE